MSKKIQSALISVYYKDGLENIIQQLHEFGVTIYSTGGTQKFIEGLNVPCVAVETLTTYPSILGGRVKTLHPSVFGGILGRRNHETDVLEMKEYNIPEIDLVIVDLYPFEETVAEQKLNASISGTEVDESLIIEKIDIGGPSMIRSAAKNFQDVVVIAAKRDYSLLEEFLQEQGGTTTLEQRRMFAVKAFDVCTGYDLAISNYFNQTEFINPFGKERSILRYGENPHQPGVFYGNQNEIFNKLHGKELSYNNIVDVDAAIQLISEAAVFSHGKEDTERNANIWFAIIKHTNVCGMAAGETLQDAWNAALAGDPESAFGGALVTNAPVDKATADAVNELFFEVLIAPSFEEDALAVLKSKKNRILLQLSAHYHPAVSQYRSVLNGILAQQNDIAKVAEPGTDWKEAGGRETTETEKEDLVFANIIAKHLKSNAIALVKNKQLIGKGCGQTSRIDALRQSIEKAKQFNFNLKGSALASDAFFPFDDCVRIAHGAGITSFIQPGGSIRDNDSIQYCKDNKLAMVITGIRHFKH